MALSLTAGYLGQAQVAPDSALAPGTYAAFSESASWSLSPKQGMPDASVYVAPGKGTVATTRDPDIGINGIYDFGDGAQTNVINSVFPQLLGSPYVPQTRLWAYLLDAQTKFTQLSCYLTELGLDSTDPNALTKITTKFGYDGSPTLPYTTGTNGAIIAPTTSLSPTAAYLASVSVNFGGASTAFTGGEAMTQIGATTSYQLPTLKRAIDIGTALVLGGGAASIPYTGDAQFGIINFATAPTAAPVVTSGKYWTMTKLIGIQKMMTTMSFMLDVTTALSNSGNAQRFPAQRDVKAALTAFAIATDIPQGTGGAVGTNSWRQLWENRAPILVEHDPDGQQQRVFRGWFIPDTVSESPDPTKTVTQSVGLTGADQTLRGAIGNSGSKLLYAGFSMGKP